MERISHHGPRAGDYLTIVRGFPYAKEQWLLDRTNHVYVQGVLSAEHGRGWHSDDEGYLCAEQGTPAGDFIQSMLDAADAYPVLDQKSYYDGEWRGSVAAVRKRAAAEGTIVNPVDALDLLLASDVEVIEDHPMRWLVDLSSEEWAELFGALNTLEEEE